MRNCDQSSTYGKRKTSHHATWFLVLTRIFAQFRVISYGKHLSQYVQECASDSLLRGHCCLKIYWKPPWIMYRIWENLLRGARIRKIRIEVNAFKLLQEACRRLRLNLFGVGWTWSEFGRRQLVMHRKSIHWQGWGTSNPTDQKRSASGVDIVRTSPRPWLLYLVLPRDGWQHLNSKFFLFLCNSLAPATSWGAFHLLLLSVERAWCGLRYSVVHRATSRIPTT